VKFQSTLKPNAPFLKSETHSSIEKNDQVEDTLTTVKKNAGLLEPSRTPTPVHYARIR